MDPNVEHGQGPSSLESEYDDYLAFSDVDLGSPTGENAERVTEPIRFVPFVTVHKAPVKFKSPQRQVFIPGEEVELTITEYERSVTTHLLNPNLYTIDLKHGNFQWEIKKRYKDILHLHQQLRLFRASLNIPFPTKSHKERRSSFKNETSKGKTAVSKGLARFPSRPEALVPYERVEHRARQLEEYLRNILKINIYRNHYETAIFFEVSEFSFIGALGGKGKEGLIEKRTRSAYPGSTGCNFFGCLDSGLCVRCHYICGDLCASWRTRWLVVKDNFVAYIRPKDGRIKGVILFDSGFDVSSGLFSTGLIRGLHICNLSRQIVVSCSTRRVAQEWQSFIKETVRKLGSDFTQRNRYFSFTPVRTMVSSAWFVDGRAYMSAVAVALEQATQEIFIADWWLSPEIHMKRPALEGDYWRLDTILKRKADQGVKVFVLLYKEVEMAIGINSYYSKQRLISANPENIKVLRHPDHAKAGVFFWAHHEKMVVIDQSIAFVGGIDLCYGRWDDHLHRLTDLGSMVENNKGIASFLSLAMATNALNASIMAVTKKDKNGGTSVNGGSFNDITLQPSPENIKCNTPEMERKSLFDTVRSRGREFISFWSFSSEEEADEPDNKDDKSTREMLEKERETASLETTDYTILPNDTLDDLQKVDEDVNDLNGSAKLWIGKDYTNFILKDFENLDLPYQDLVDRTKTARMPWHDVGVMVQGSAARDLARHFIQRWNAVKLEKAKLNPQYPYLLPKSYKDFSDFMLPGIRQIKVSCQVVRSISHWSGGFIDCDSWEGSIHEAMVDAIAKARHYVYIENQFFISCGNGGQVKNQVGDALFKRILRAHREDTIFRVYVVLPLLPGFEGEVGTPSGTALHAITHWNYASICRGNDSLLVRLREAGIETPEEYITFHGLRNHAILDSLPITELIYVHSKLMIVDDRLMICGSANINDRSLIGKRDSEIAVVIEDEEFKEGQMNGERYFSGKLCGSLRRYLFREHLGLLGSPHPRINVNDPISADFYHDVWRATAQTNTDIFEEVFNCIPSDKIKSFQDIESDELPPSVTDPIGSTDKLQNVQGHLVMFPLHFLCEETLTPNPGSVQGMLPTSLWT
ncbi:phospholipase D isoform X2 [Rhodnius prolixus]|uniref:phospholipase D isoform X1 n=1 Tax=Rhodnius prolixus TaxID=13249 RepID=UPI003D188F71